MSIKFISPESIKVDVLHYYIVLHCDKITWKFFKSVLQLKKTAANRNTLQKHVKHNGS